MSNSGQLKFLWQSQWDSPGPLDSPPTVLQLRRWYRPQCGHRSARPNETPSVGTPGSWHGHVDRVGPCPRLLFRKNQKGSSWIKSDQTGKVQMAEFSCAAAVRKSASSSSKRWIWAFRNANTCHRKHKSFSALLCHWSGRHLYPKNTRWAVPVSQVVLALRSLCFWLLFLFHATRSDTMPNPNRDMSVSQN